MHPLVLVVGDPSPFRHAVAQTLGDAAFSVYEVDGVPAALAALEHDDVAAVIAPPHVGEYSGIWLLEWIKVLRAETVTILLSPDRTPVQPAGRVDAVLRVPLSPGAIVDRLDALAPRARAAKQAPDRPTIELLALRETSTGTDGPRDD